MGVGKMEQCSQGRGAIISLLKLLRNMLSKLLGNRLFRHSRSSDPSSTTFEKIGLQNVESDSKWPFFF